MGKKKNIIGARIRKTRLEAKPPITQEDLVARLQLDGLKIDQGMISRIESGTRLVTDIEVKAIAKALKIEVGFEGEGEDSGKHHYESAIRQIVNQAVASTEVVDIFDAAGLKKPDISLLSEEFLQDVKEMMNRNLSLELLKKILNDEIKVRLKYNIVEGKNLLQMLETSIKKYQNNLLTTAEIIEELLNIARQVRTVDGLAEKLKLNKDEFAFYTALEVNDSAVKVLGDETLKTIAREIADKVRKNATIDWNMKESARAKLMVLVKRTLNKYGYPPDKQQKAIDTVLKQAEVLADYWTEGTV